MKMQAAAQESDRERGWRWEEMMNISLNARLCPAQLDFIAQYSVVIILHSSSSTTSLSPHTPAFGLIRLTGHQFL